MSLPARKMSRIENETIKTTEQSAEAMGMIARLPHKPEGSKAVVS